ncbi:ligand-binding protein SH3 [Anaerobacillus alkalidiazotrophicus]|uniref:Ligand-binding protein SH3 n=1 Tax=Anaerobacillus alkalidiazotrophicus TaxID=472963 RepID=A0A1S2MB27_9BACI|nr:small multi-drug export protein [Anaerobacillus alkalidiazotrophicus]OIJ21962.1 ligand-binding protein SH3 [Anaerobacillus alkalidiazotrophicus]
MKESFQNFLVENLSFLPTELIVVIISAMPILELRGGIPFAFLAGLSFGEALFYGILGNLLPVIPILILFRPLSSFLMRFPLYKRFFDWLYNRTMKKSENVEKFGALGLILFTAIPLPTTGAWSACLAAILFFIPFRAAFIAISSGVVIAGIGVSLFVYSVF